ncbi:hypothetical protein PspLS_12045, partial [Pyricularia sp. CBS 133598]
IFAPIFPGFTDRLRSRNAGAFTTLSAVGPPTTGLVRKPLLSGKLMAFKPTPAAVTAPFRRVIKTSKKNTSCLDYFRSTLAGKQGSGDLAVCRKTSPPSGRCYKCASGYFCENIPAFVRPPASRFFTAIAFGDKDLIIKWCPVVKGMLEICKEKKKGGSVVVTVLSVEKKKKEAKRAVLRLVNILF